MGTNIFRELTGKEHTLINDEPNCRTPQFVNKYMEVFFENYCNTFRNNNIGKSENKINGFPTKTIFYEKENLLAKLENSINTLIAIGDNKKNIVIVSCLPLDANSSVLLRKKSWDIPYAYEVDKIGNYTLQRETGFYNKNAHKIYQDKYGIRCESIYKYKGLEDAVILVIDVENPDDYNFTNDEWAKRLYCAFTRATLNLEVFVDNDGNMKEFFKKQSKPTKGE